MPKASKNTYVKGMNQDVSRTKYQNTYFFHLKNGRVVTDKGLSTGSIENIKGNKLSFTVPETKNVFKMTGGFLSFKDKPKNPIPGNEITIVTDSNTYTVPIPIGSSFLNEVEYIDEAEDQLLVLQQANPDTFDFNRDNELCIRIRFFSENIISITDPIGVFTSEEITPEYTDLKINGFTTIRDDIVLFTTNSEDEEPVSDGQIWVMTYNKTTLVPSFELVYNNEINFSLANRVEAVGRYETSNIQRVYWTDIYNEVRSMNVVDDESFWLDPALISLIPATTFSKPIMADDNVSAGGILEAGVYQYAYRIISASEAQTKFSPLSNLVHIVEKDERNDPYWKEDDEYNGTDPGFVTGKKVSFDIKGLDTNYDSYQVVVIYRQDGIGVTSIELLPEKPIPLNGEDSFVHTGSATAIPITLEEFQLTRFSFTHAKSIASKDNRLFAANIRVKNFHNFRFNARAYRYKSVAQGKTTYVDPNADPFDENIDQDDLDAINPDQDVYSFQSNGINLGGQGPNVSYTFEQQDLLTDIYTDLDPANARTRAPIVGSINSGRTYDLGVPDQLHVQDKGITTFKSPMINGLLRGYQRGETYRFGLVLYDLQGRPGFVEWIGDIKIPFANESRDASGDPNKFQYARINSEGRQESRQIGINFTVQNVPATFSGYSIVRVKREDTDKTVLGTGIINRVTRVDHHRQDNDVNVETETEYFNIIENKNKRISDAKTSIILQNNHFLEENSDDSSARRMLTFDCPDFHFKGVPTFTNEDKLIVISNIRKDEAQVVEEGDFQTDSSYIKYIESQSISSVSLNVEDIFQVENAGVVSGTELPGGFNFYNYALRLSLIDGEVFTADTLRHKEVISKIAESAGSKTALVLLEDPVANSAIGDMANSTKNKTIATYIRNLASQYGGATDIARSSNQYISCGHFKPISDSGSFDETVDSVYGGDSYTLPYGISKLSRNFGSAASDKGQGIHFDIPDEKFEASQIFPTSSSINVDMRRGYHMVNKDVSGVYPSTANRVHDEYILANVYSAENDIVTFIPEPPFAKFEEEFDNEVHASNPKINGERFDSWTAYNYQNTLAVEGVYGPINKLQVLKDNIYYIQDRAVGVLSINPKAIVPDLGTGSELQLGQGLVLDDFTYVSTEFGSKHKWSIASSDNSMYFFDIIRKKFVRIAVGQGIGPLSDIKGLHAFFDNRLDGIVQTEDRPLLGKGINATYDFRFNECLMTFFDTDEKFTISFSEQIDGFMGFYGFESGIYINDKSNIFSPDQNDQAKVYIHNEGVYGQFYDGTPQDVELEIIINPDADITKLFNNMEFLTELYDANDDDIFDETLGTVRIDNEYQDSGVVTLVPNQNLKRRMRKWRFNVPRQGRERMRNPYIKARFTYTNNNDKRLVLHDMVTYYIVAPY